MSYYKNYSLETIIDEVDGFACVEEWKEIPGYEGKYLASSLGRIKSLPKNITLFHGGEYLTKEKILHQRFSCGYLFVALFDGNNRLDIQSHIIIGKTFLPNPENKEQINHKKGIKTDNRVSEIEWATRSENALHAYANNLMQPVWEGKCGLAHAATRKLQCLLTGQITTLDNASKWLGISKTYLNAMTIGRRPNWTNFIYF